MPAGLRKAWPRLTPVHLPIHASWLNQIEIFFSIVQRKVLTPNDFLSLQAVEERILQFQQHYQQIARPFQWHFTRKDLNKMLAKLSTRSTLRSPGGRRVTHDEKYVTELTNKTTSPDYSRTMRTRKMRGSS